MDLHQLLIFFVFELQSISAVQVPLHFQVFEYQNFLNMFAQPANDSGNRQKAEDVLQYKKQLFRQSRKIPKNFQ